MAVLEDINPKSIVTLDVLKAYHKKRKAEIDKQIETANCYYDINVVGVTNGESTTYTIDSTVTKESIDEAYKNGRVFALCLTLDGSKQKLSNFTYIENPYSLVFSNATNTIIYKIEYISNMLVINEIINEDHLVWKIKFPSE